MYWRVNDVNGPAIEISMFPLVEFLLALSGLMFLNGDATVPFPATSDPGGAVDVKPVGGSKIVTMSENPVPATGLSPSKPLSMSEMVNTKL